MESLFIIFVTSINYKNQDSIEIVLPASAFGTVTLGLRQIDRQRRVDHHYSILNLHLLYFVDGFPLREFEVDHPLGWLFVGVGRILQLWSFTFAFLHLSFVYHDLLPIELEFNVVLAPLSLLPLLFVTVIVAYRWAFHSWSHLSHFDMLGCQKFFLGLRILIGVGCNSLYFIGLAKSVGLEILIDLVKKGRLLHSCFLWTDRSLGRCINNRVLPLT